MNNINDINEVAAEYGILIGCVVEVNVGQDRYDLAVFSRTVCLSYAQDLCASNLYMYCSTIYTICRYDIFNISTGVELNQDLMWLR